MAGEQGTGKHPHKSTAEPFPHTERLADRGGASQGNKPKQEGAQAQQGGDDLKDREYRGPDGEIHHHTRTYAEQHRGE